MQEESLKEGSSPFTVTWFDLIVAIGGFFLACACFIKPVIAWDAWAYHLPFASFLWNIGGGESTYHLDPELIPTWMGFPKTVEFLQGFFWWLTGSLNAVIFPNFIVLGVYLWIVSRALKTAASFLFLAMMSCPMVLANFGSLYIDFFTCTSLAIAFFALFRYFHQRENSELKYLVTGGLFLVLAATSKYQATICAYYIILLLIANGLLAGSITSRRMLLLFGLGLCCSPVLVKNVCLHQNPFYPCRVQVGPVTLFPGPLAPSLMPDYGSVFLNLYPMRFLISATELDWAYRGVPAYYDLDSGAGVSSNFKTKGRTGGWNGTLFIISTAIVIIYGTRHRDALYRTYSWSALLIIALASELPVCNELRYSIYVPIITYPLAVALILSQCKSIAPVMVLVTLFALQSIGLRVASQIHFTKSDAENANVEQAINLHMQLHPHEFIYNDFPLLFHYSQAVTGKAVLLSNDPKDAPKTLL